MSTETFSPAGFDKLWKQESSFELDTSELELCRPAQVFEGWVKQEIEKLEPELTLATIAWAKVHLLDKYFEWKNATPRSHKDKRGRGRHPCLYQVFEDGYKMLQALHLGLASTNPLVQPAPRTTQASLPDPTLAFDEDEWAEEDD